MKTFFYLLISVVLVNAYAANTTPEKKAVPKAKTLPKKRFSQSRAYDPKEKERLEKLENISKKAIVIIKGKSGSGTGFVAEFNGKKVIITNNHVIKGNGKLTFLTQSGEKLKVKNLFIPKDRDLAIFELEDNSISPLQIFTNVGELKNSTQVVVYGNSLGASVITTVKGTLQGTGPRDIETNAGFVEGNSGSPIIDLSTGKVIGVATYATMTRSWTTKDTKFEVRRFGTRIDNITWDDFQIYDKKKYERDIDTLKKLENSIRIGYAFFKHFKPYFYFDGKDLDEFDTNLRDKIFPLHCTIDKDLKDIPEMKSVYRQWNRVCKINEDRLEGARHCEMTRRGDNPFKGGPSGTNFNATPFKTDLRFLMDFQTNYFCMKYTIPRLIANGRKQVEKKPFHYEYFKREGEKLLEIEVKLTKDYDKMMKNLTIIYNAKK